MAAAFRRFLKKFFYNHPIDVYTDGSQKGAWGSWAFVVIKKNKTIHEDCGRMRGAGSNQMEFQAAENALSFLSDSSNLRIFTDSRILINAMTTNDQPLAYQEQITHLKTLSLNKQITWHWIKAHSGNHFNERCDELCVQAREGKAHTKLSISN